MDKKIYKYIGILVGLIVALIVLVWLYNVITGGSKLNFVQLEEKLVTATKKYADEHKAVLPTEPGTSMIVSSTVLISNGYIDELSSYMSNPDIICNGSVEIYSSNVGYYDYVPTLSCGSEQSVKLYDKIISDNAGGVAYGSGLYQRIDGEFITDEESLGTIYDDYETFEYIFRGDEVNNYVKIDENYWRIVSINDTNDILLIYVGHPQKTVPWDDRYNEEVRKNQGINIYEEDGIKSRAMENVEKFYNGELILMAKEVYSDKTKYLTTPMNLCVGKRNTTASNTTGEIECRTILENQNAGLLPAYAYMSASLDEECNSIISKNCGNYNYLSQFDDQWWLLTASDESTHEAYSIAKKYATLSLCSTKSNIRPTILLGSRAIYESGTGTKADPYTVKFFGN